MRRSNKGGRIRCRCTLLVQRKVATSANTGGSNSPVAVPEISCSLIAHEISTAATRLPRFFCRRQRSDRSPPACCELVFRIRLLQHKKRPLTTVVIERTDSLRCGEATAVAIVHRTIAKSRLSNPISSPTTKKTSSFELVFFVVGEDGFEPSKRYAADLQSVPFGHSGTPPYSVSVSEWSR